MMLKTISFLLTLTAATTFAGEPSPKDVVAQLYQAHRSKHDPFQETRSLSRYFDPELTKLYLRDVREAKAEVSKLIRFTMRRILKSRTSPFRSRKRLEKKRS